VNARAVAARLAASAAARWRQRLTAGARDATDAVAGRSLMVLAPHPDDETFGCGALIARARAAGSTVTVVIATDGSRCTTSARLGPAEIVALRRAELRAAAGRLGVAEADIIELGYADGTLADDPAALAAALTDLGERLRPDIVLVPCAQDHHPDHRALHDAAVTADVAPVLLAYPVWTWHSAPFFLEAPAAARPRLWVWAARQTGPAGWWRVPTGPYLGRKRQAVAAYVSQTTNYTGEPGWSFLPPRFTGLFLGTDEVFLPLRAGRRPPTGVSRRCPGTSWPAASAPWPATHRRSARRVRPGR
jgi:LmbE family N-acetylglucosaminyl deacetylase